MADYITIFATFKGEDKSLGLKKHHVYKLELRFKDGYLWATWHNGSCPYSNFKKFFENWEELPQ